MPIEVKDIKDDEKVVSNIPKKYHFEEPPITTIDGRKNRRPTLYTDGRKQKILLALKAGASERHAAGYGGISLKTFRNWIDRGSAADEDSEGVDADMRDFVAACLHAGANNALFLIKSIMKGAEDDPEIALKALPMLHARDYSPQITQRVAHEVEGTVEHVHEHKMNLEHATYEELEQLETIALRLEKGDVVDAEIVDEKN